VTLLRTRGLRAFYGDFQALFGVDVTVGEGETVAVIGANGAGKTTLLRAVAGVLRCRAEMVEFDGRPIGVLSAHEIVRLGIAMVPEGRQLFPSLTVEENLLVGAYCGRAGAWSLARVYELFPILAERRALPAPSLSGGEQQMAAIGRALMSNPRLLLCDELSLGLAPVAIRDIYLGLGALAAAGMALIIVEQDIGRALAAAARFYCLREGRVALTGEARGVDRETITSAYFGL
jgi:branched-chain amino acid transport system ATP-binding protein